MPNPPPAHDAPLYAAVELGSNSFRFQVGRADGATIHVTDSMYEPVRLVAGLDANGCLPAAALQPALACLREFRDVLAAWPLQAVRVVATSALRVARNAPAFLPLAEQAIGRPVEVISGVEEGRLVYLGAASALAAHDERRLVLDIGAGSTGLMLGCGRELAQVDSFGIGAIRQGLSFFGDGAIDSSGFAAAIGSARTRFADAAPFYGARSRDAVYGSSGTIRALAALAAAHGLGDGALTPASADGLQRCFIEAGHVQRIALPGLGLARPAALAGGLAILIALMEQLAIERLVPVEAGLRMGVLWDLHRRATAPAPVAAL
jgi:exopolyphosphatase/guanosine-5'-triphosphate,3'-diphosphate pyrophosphatase